MFFKHMCDWNIQNQYNFLLIPFHTYHLQVIRSEPPQISTFL